MITIDNYFLKVHGVVEWLICVGVTEGFGVSHVHVLFLMDFVF